MTESLNECLAQAAKARAAGEAEPLENVRQKHFASAKTWEDLSDRVARMTKNRKRRRPATTIPS